jgi:hypothetical protein
LLKKNKKMKKFIVIALALIIGISSSFAQSTNQIAPAPGDVIVNTGTVTKKLNISSGLSGIIVGANIVVNSGTGAGSIQPQVSFDGVTYYNSGSAYTITAATPQQATILTLTAPTPQYIQFVVTGSGVVNETVKIFYRATKYQPTP